MAITNKEKYEQLLKSIDWENYRLSGEECDEQHQYMDLCKVLDIQLSVLQINLSNPYQYRIVENVKTLLSLLNEEKLKSII